MHLEKQSIYPEAEPTNLWLTSVWVNNILMTDCSFIAQHERKQIIDIFQSKLICFLPSVTNIQRHNFCFLFRHKLSTYGETSRQPAQFAGSIILIKSDFMHEISTTPLWSGKLLAITEFCFCRNPHGLCLLHPHKPELQHRCCFVCSQAPS